MDGNLLDPETADETLAKDWNLPELPEGNSSLPSTSQELAEIFGTSDDEDDVDFPFSLSGGLPGELSLPNTDTKKFENSLLGNTNSELFLNTFHDALSSMTPVPVSMSRSLKEADMKGGGASNDIKTKDGASNEKGAELMETNTTNGSDKDQKPSAEMKTTPEDGSTTDDTKKAEEQQTAPSVRKSARLRQRNIADEDQEDSSNNKAAGTAKVKQEPDGSTVKEEPQVKVEDEKPKEDDRVVKKEEEEEGEGPESLKEEDRRYVKSEESESGDEESDGSEEESDEDPDRLWCICRQPHDDRFMICCDQCEEWYHGDCVGISVGQGKRMEREGKEYVCPVCISRLQDAKEEREINRSARQARREEVREKDLKKKVGQVRRRISSGSGASHIPKPEEDQYGMAQLFLPDNAPKERKGDPAKAGSPVKIRKEEAPSHCVGPGCQKPTTPPSVYCSQDCIEKHAAYSLKKLSDRGVVHSSNPSEFVRGPGGVSVVEKGTGKLVVGVGAPSEKNLIPWLMEHPSYQVYLHTKAGKKIKMKANKKPKVEKKEPESPKMPKIPLMDPKSVRANAKKALFQTLWKRREDVSDLSDLDQEAVEKVANDIEEKLHNLYQDINPKYKNKYRSLLFNLKDTRNPGLFRKVLRGDIDTRQLVRMSSEKLASEELAQWRVQTIKKDLEKIKEREEEVGAMGGTIRKMTYKGEVEIEHTEEHIDTIDTSKDPNALLSKSTSQTSKSQSDSTKSHSQSKSQPDTSSTKKPSGSILDLLTDTTSQHHNHIYDHHCAICSGKMKKPPSPPQAQDQPASDSSHPSPDSRTADNELMDTISPDTAHVDDINIPEEPVIWRGEFNMHGMAKFNATAYAVSGPMECLDEILPPVLEVMGRIAHVQVWDYIDKLRSSTSRDIAILRFEQVDEDSEAYIAMVNYLVGKHRCGVIKSGYHGIKDMYLLPLLSLNRVAPQLLPFDGPGLPYDHPDMLLGVIVRSKNKKRPSLSQRLASQSVAAAPPPAFLPTSSETGIKRHNSASDEMYGGQKVKRTRFQLEIGIGDQTPPILDQEEEKEKPDDDSPYEPGSLDPVSAEVKEGEERLMKKIQMSFYGEHRPMELSTEISGSKGEPSSNTASEASAAAEAAPGGSIAELSLQSSNFQSLLSQLSKEKLEELASVVSSVRGQPGGTGTAASAPGATAVNQSPTKAVDSSSSVGTSIQSSTVEGGGGIQPQLNANYNTSIDQGVTPQMAPSQAPHWNQDQMQQQQQQQLPQEVQPPQQQQHTQYYQATARYSGHAEQHNIVQQPALGTAVAVGSGTSDQFQQQQHQAYPSPQAQGGGPYGNYPPVQNQAMMEAQQQHQDGRPAGAANASPYASSPSQQQQYGGNQQPPHGHLPPTGAPPHHGHTHHQWEQHQGYQQRNYGHGGGGITRGGHSNYYDGGHGYRDGYGENRMPPHGPPPPTGGPHHQHHHQHGKPGSGGGWGEGRGHGDHRGHPFHSREHDRYHDHWHGRGDHDRERHWR